MHIFKRSKSAVAKNPIRYQDSTSSSQPSLSSSRLPLLPQTNIDLHAAQPSMPLADSASSASARTSFEDPSKCLAGRKTSHRDANDLNNLRESGHSSSSSIDSSKSGSAVSSPRTSPRSARTIYTPHSDMYTQNDLNTFSFGAAPATSASSSLFPPIDPLFRHRDEAESDEVAFAPDTTPRPSVVGNHSDRTHTSQSHGLESWPSSVSFSSAGMKPTGKNDRPGDPLRDPDSDTASTFGTGSASASVSSLAKPRGQSSRSTSRVSDHTNETPQSSANDSTSDEEMDGRHPIPPGALDLNPHGLRTPDRESVLYLSEEDFEGDDYEPDPIDSFADETDRGMYYTYSGGSQDNIQVYVENERRGSLAVDIPGASDRPHLDHRTRNTYSRRPSKSMEDLHSFSFAQASSPSMPGSRRIDNHPLPPAPTSVPESEGDWREVRKRSVQRDKDLPPIFNSVTTLSPTDQSDYNSILNNDLVMGSSSTSDGQNLDLQWTTYGVNGVIGFDMSEMSDIVGTSGPNGQRVSYVYTRRGSNSSAFGPKDRRTSTVSSTNMDIMHRNLRGIWASKTDGDRRQKWSFMKAKDDENVYNRHHGGLEKVQDRPSISTLLGSRPSTSTGADLSRATSISFFDKLDSKEKEKSLAKDKSSKQPWRGMALDSQEIWSCPLSGNFRVLRKNSPPPEPGKPEQQRLNVQYIRTSSRDPEGPTVTIHKHSKANAFSISRYYRARKVGPHDTSLSLQNNAIASKQGQPRNDTGEQPKKPTNMVMLAPRRVQQAYTSTNTTKKLESHGLLDESGRTSPRDMDRMRREQDREKAQRTKEKDKERRRKENGKGKERVKEGTAQDEKHKRKPAGSSSKPSQTNKGEVQSHDMQVSGTTPESSGGSSTGSVANGVSSGDSGTFAGNSIGRIVTTSKQSEATSSAGSVSSSADPGRSIGSHETTTSEQTISQKIQAHHNQPRKRGVLHDDASEDEDDEDSSDERPRHPTRTPHSETYHTLPATTIENVVQQHPSHGFFAWGRSRGGDRSGVRPNYLDTPYNPPWPVTQPRSFSDARKGIVDDLNISFQDVGLLPVMGEIKGSSHSAPQKRKHDQHLVKHVKRSADKKTTTDIFKDIHDYLYMLLPLWPGDTDALSAKKHPYTPPHIPTQNRQYLLISYRPDQSSLSSALEETSKTKSAEKKRSRENPSSSGDVEKGVFLTHFHISARVVSHRDLQGTGVRIPEVGLAVSGPLEEAYMSIPTDIPAGDYVLGVCHSRAGGIEFEPYGFETMGLSRSVPALSPQEPMDADDLNVVDFQTPIGRAVMEMAWLGGMALSSFIPNP